MKTKKIATVTTGILMLLCLGLIYGWSIFVAPLENEFGWARSQTSLTFTISIAFFCIGGLTGGILTTKKVRRLILLVAAGALLAAGFNGASLSSELVHFYIFYGVLCGFGVGLSYNVIISSVTRLFPEKQGFVSGLLMMGFGFGGLILGSLCSSLLVSMGWRSTFMVIGLLMGAILISGAMLLEFTGKGICTGPVRNPGKSSSPAAGTADLNTPGMLRTKTFQFFFLWMILLSAAGLMIIGHIAPCILELGGSRSTAALAVGIVSVFNGIGRVGFGISYDRLSIQKTLWLVNGCLMLAGILLSFAVNSANMPLLFLGCAVMGISYGGSPVSASAVVSRLFGSASFSSNFSVASLNLMFAALIGPTLAANLQDRSGSYQTSFYVLVALGIVSLVLCLILTRLIDRRLGATSLDRSDDASVV